MRRATAGTRRARVVLLAALTGAVLMLSACGSDAPGDNARSTSPPGSPTVSPTASSGQPGAPEILAQAGMTLPAQATDVQVEEQEMPPYRASYRVTLRLPLEAAKDWCRGDKLGGPLVAVVIPDAQRPFLKMSSAPQGSIICMSSWPQDVSWQRVVLAQPATGDAPGEVTVAIYRMPAH